MGTHLNWTYYGNHFAIYTNIQWLHCIPETNIMLCQLFLNFLKRIQERWKTTRICFFLLPYFKWHFDSVHLYQSFSVESLNQILLSIFGLSTSQEWICWSVMFTIKKESCKNCVTPKEGKSKAPLITVARKANELGKASQGCKPGNLIMDKRGLQERRLN